MFDQAGDRSLPLPRAELAGRGRPWPPGFWRFPGPSRGEERPSDRDRPPAVTRPRLTTVAFPTIGYVLLVDDALTDADEAQLQSFTEALEGLAQRLGGVSVVTASVACQVAFGPPEKMTAWQRRAVNRVLAAYRVRLEFPEHEQPPAI